VTPGLRRLCATLAALGATGAWGEVRLLAKAPLTQALKTEPPCCVVDARADAQRQARPIRESLVYKPGLKIHPSATVVVVADSDAAALKVASALEKAYPGKTIAAVKGGYPVWEAILIDQERASGSVQGSRSFVIPRNTCEQDTPLQTLMRKAAP
jgi:hypothetical protein